MTQIYDFREWDLMKKWMVVLKSESSQKSAAIKMNDFLKSMKYGATFFFSPVLIVSPYYITSVTGEMKQKVHSNSNALKHRKLILWSIKSLTKLQPLQNRLGQEAPIHHPHRLHNSPQETLPSLLILSITAKFCNPSGFFTWQIFPLSAILVYYVWYLLLYIKRYLYTSGSLFLGFNFPVKFSTLDMFHRHCSV